MTNRSVFLLFPLLAAGSLMLFAGACATTHGPAHSTASTIDSRTRFALQATTGLKSALQKTALEALYTGFKQRGYVPSAPDEADFLISCHLFSVKLPPNSVFANGWMGPAVYTDADFQRHYFPGNQYIFRQSRGGQLVAGEARVFLLSVQDKHNGQVLWRGWQTFDSGRPLSAKQIPMMVNEVLGRLPPAEPRT